MGRFFGPPSRRGCVGSGLAEAGAAVSLTGMTEELSLPPNAALIVIDLQHAIDDPRRAVEGPRNNQQAEAVVASLLAAWRGTGRPIIHVRHDSTEPDSSYRPGQSGNDFKPEVAPLPGESILSKQTNSAFIGTGLEAQLRADGIATLVVTGVQTNNSVEATVRMAGNLGFRTYLVADGCFTFARRDYDGVWHSAATVHALSLANLDREYCTVVNSAAVLAAIGRAG